MIRQSLLKKRLTRISYGGENLELAKKLSTKLAEIPDLD